MSYSVCSVDAMSHLSLIALRFQASACLCISLHSHGTLSRSSCQLTKQPQIVYYIMKTAIAKKSSTALRFGGVAKKKKKAKLPKTSTAVTLKKSKPNGDGAATKTGKSTSVERGLRTPDRKKRNKSSAPSTPSTTASQSTSSSKRVLTFMSDLQLETPPRKKKGVQDATSGIDFRDASAIEWLSMHEVRAALEYHSEHHSELQSFDLGESILLLCTFFKPNDIRPVYQGLCQEAGWDWRSLSLAKLKSMKTLAPEFAKACVDIVNARTDSAVPAKITLKKKKRDGRANA